MLFNFKWIQKNIFNVTCYHIVGCSVDLMPSFFFLEIQGNCTQGFVILWRNMLPRCLVFNFKL